MSEIEKIKNTELWKNCFSEIGNPHIDQITKDLANSYFKVRTQASMLVSEISIDLPQFSIHDISHLDALWSSGSQVVGSNISLNPVEGFILGCSFLMHDAAMSIAAYPGGLKEIKSTKEWRIISAKLHANDTDQEYDDQNVLDIFLREQHAIRAEQLPFISWSRQDSTSGPLYIIEDGDLRAKFGQMIGRISASHWWSYEKLETELKHHIPSVPPPYPDNWSIDLLKLSCILRTADAAQIDSTRAPGFIFSLRQHKLSDLSRRHWLFQNRLTQPQNRGDELHFSSTMAFEKKEAKSWWLLYDSLKMVDEELRRASELLIKARGKGAEFASKRVAHIERPDELTRVVPTVGWKPVDTKFSVKDIPTLIRKLGGEELYGREPFVAVREIIQNAMDAVRLRQVVDSSKPNPLVTVELQAVDDGVRLIVSDRGVGMSQSSIVQDLLSFGSSGWLADNSIGEYTEYFPNKSNFSGRYGIGFFSIFMLGQKVKVVSCRFDRVPSETVNLEFLSGLDERPLLSQATGGDRIINGGTRVEVDMDLNLLEKYPGRFKKKGNWYDASRGVAALANELATMFPTSDVPIEVIIGGQKQLIDGRAWETEQVSSLLSRIEGEASSSLLATEYFDAIRLIINNSGETIGRACLVPQSLTHTKTGERKRTLSGVVTSKGAKLLGGNFRGVLLGTPSRASRDSGDLIGQKEEFSQWASEQAKILLDIVVDPEDQLSVAGLVHSLGGNVGSLKICQTGNQFMTVEDLKLFLSKRDEVWVVPNHFELNQPGIVYMPDTIYVASSMNSFIYEERLYGRRSDFRKFTSLRDLVVSLITAEFNLPVDVADKWKIVDSDGFDNIHKAKAPVWKKDDGKVQYLYGQYYHRGMTSDMLDKYLVNN